MPRAAHLVGSLPGSTARQAMSTALDILGPYLRSLPDGETGVRRNWIISIIEGLRENPALEVRRDGDWWDYDKTPQLRIRKGHRLYGANLDFGHVDAVRDSYPQFEDLRNEHGNVEVVFQQGVPGTSTWRCSPWVCAARFAIGSPSPRPPCARFTVCEP